MGFHAISNQHGLVNYRKEIAYGNFADASNSMLRLPEACSVTISQSLYLLVIITPTNAGFGLSGGTRVERPVHGRCQ